MDYYSLNFLYFAIISIPILSLTRNTGKYFKFSIAILSTIFISFWSVYSAILVWCNSIFIYAIARSIFKNPKMAYLGIALQILIFLGFKSFFNVPTGYLTGMDQKIYFIGLGYYTLLNISFIFDLKAKRVELFSFVDYICYIVYFPKFLLGPIEKFDEFCKKISNPSVSIFWQKAIYLILLGVFKHFIISSRLLDFYSDMSGIFSTGQPIPIYLTSAVMSFFALYCDFSSYIDIGRGLSLLVGINLEQNFNLPYFAKNPMEFWQRWHMSLSRFMRDYLYYPALLKTKNIYFSILFTFIVVGIWHGFSWYLMVWAFCWFLFQSIYVYLASKTNIKLPTFLSIIITFFVNALIGLNTYHVIFLKKEVLNLTFNLPPVSGLLYQNYSMLYACLVTMIVIEYLETKIKSNWFYYNAIIFLIFLINALVVTKSYFFYYLKV